MQRFYYLFFFVLLTACSHNEVDRGIYFWKSKFVLSETESDFVKKHDVKKIYIKYFDVDIDPSIGKPIPIATVDFKEKPTKSYRIVPTVFITNRSLQRLNKLDIEDLANKICQRIIEMNTNFMLEDIIEIQIDCDWTFSTQKKYFELLKNISKNYLLEDKILSATIRLHQIKYVDETGIPPVDRGLLMCYNICNIKDYNVKNSIFDLTEAEKYIDNLNEYKLPLDIALPIYGWGVVFSAQKFRLIINNLDNEDLTKNQDFEEIQSNYFKAIKRTEINGYHIDKNEIIRVEGSEMEEIIKFSKKTKMNNKNYSVVLFHLDEKIINRFKNHEAEKIYTHFD
jgi:hypothetical protein